MSIVENTEHVKDALSKLILQFQEKAQLEAFLTSFITQVQLLDNTLIDLFNSRNLDLATGAQLDQLGALVGEPRSGNTDAVYRSYIRTRILTNSSGGTPEDLLNVVAAIYSGITGNTYYFEAESANPLPHYQINRFGTGEIAANVAAQIINRATPAGVPGSFIYQSDEDSTFACSIEGLTSDLTYLNWDSGHGMKVTFDSGNVIENIVFVTNNPSNAVTTSAILFTANIIWVNLANTTVGGANELIEAENTCAKLKLVLEALTGVASVEIEDATYSWGGFGIDYDVGGGGEEHREAREFYYDVRAFWTSYYEGSTLTPTTNPMSSEAGAGFGGLFLGGGHFRNRGELTGVFEIGDGSPLDPTPFPGGINGPAGLTNTFYVGDIEYTPEALFVADDFDADAKTWPARVGGITLEPVGTGVRAYLAQDATTFPDATPVVRFAGGTALASTETLVGDMGGRNSFIIEVLYRGDDEVGNEAIFSKIDSNSLLSSGWWVNYQTLAVINLADGLGTSARTYFRSTTSVDNSVWRYLVFALDADNDVSVIWDGGAGGSVQLTNFPGGEDTTGWANITAPLAIGSYSSAVSAKFNGDIARAGIWLTPGLNLVDTTNFFAECERRYKQLGFVPGSDI